MSISPPADIFGVDGIIVLVVVVLVLFGSTQIPKLARSLGSAQKEFKKGLEEGGGEASTNGAAVQPAPPPAVAPPAPVPPPAQPSVIPPGESTPRAPGS